MAISQGREPTAEEKPGGQPVDNRWTAVDNRVRPGGLWIGDRVYTLVLHTETTSG
jgi:hypothetical protein